MSCTTSRSQPQKDRILKVADVAAEPRCSKSHVYKLLNGRVPGLPVAPRADWKLSQLNAHLREVL